MKLYQWAINDEHEIQHHPLWGWEAQQKRVESGEPSTIVFYDAPLKPKPTAGSKPEPARPVATRHVPECVDDPLEEWERF